MYLWCPASKTTITIIIFDPGEFSGSGNSSSIGVSVIIHQLELSICVSFSLCLSFCHLFRWDEFSEFEMS